MIISIGADHAGFAHKEALKAMLIEDGHDVRDVGTHSLERVDYPDFGVAAARLVSNETAQFGVVVCGSGIGISIAANKVRGIRCANCTSVEMATLARLHNNCNMIAIGERLSALPLSMDMVRAFLSTDFEGGRHTDRVAKLDMLGDI
ncbi:ribose 5-phosphate isomerase B [soil metagenome]